MNEQSDFCYAKGDEGAEFCGDPRSRHHTDEEVERLASCSEQEKFAHLVPCMRDDHLIHHVFIPFPLSATQESNLPCPVCRQPLDVLPNGVEMKLNNIGEPKPTAPSHSEIDIAPSLLLCFRCRQTDGLWIEEDPDCHPALRYQVVCSCGLMGLSAESKEKAALWWNERSEHGR